jgi:hypothetical protein
MRRSAFRPTPLRSGIWPSVASPDEYDTAQERETFRHTAAIGWAAFQEGKDAPSVAEIGLRQKAWSEKVAEKEALLAKQEIEFARFLEKGHDVSPTKPEAVNPARETPLGVREPVDEIETVGQLLEATKMACGDLPSDAIGPLRTLLSVIKMVCATGPGLERDVRELIEAASMACVDLPPREARALRTLLRAPQGSLARPRPGSGPRMTGRPSSAFLGVP